MLSDVLTRLGDYQVRRSGVDRWTSKCPSHDDGTASLSIALGTSGRVLLKCHAGCSAQDVVQALQLELGALFDDSEREDSQPPEKWPVVGTHVYRDEHGANVMRVVKRRSPESGKKTFRQERWEGGDWRPGLGAGVRAVPYNLPRIVEKETFDEPVFVVEGEKDADALTDAGFIATTNAGGAGKWTAEHAKWLKGREVVVIPDNDTPGNEHAKSVVESLKGIADTTRVLRLPNLPNKGDVSDWLGAGGTPPELRSMVNKLRDGARFIPSLKRLQGEREERLMLGSRRLSFGVNFLDMAMGGINRRDLVLLGAKTGVGKTALATSIALTNAKRGKKVHAFFLEAEDREMERRVKYRILAGLYYSREMEPRPIRYIDWYNGELEREFSYYEEEAERQMASIFANVSTYYRGASFTADDLEEHIDKLASSTDLVILDHFHYFDDDGDSEVRAQRERAKRIRDSALRAELPFVLVAHVRKGGDPRYAPLIPSIDDYHGAADLARIPTKAIMMGPDYETKTGDSWRWSTFIHINKCRQENAVTRYVARVVYDTHTERYEDGFELGRLVDNGRRFEPIEPSEYPEWARERKTQ